MTGKGLPKFRKSSSGAPAQKTPKRQHDQVSPISPELSLAFIKSTLQGELKPLYEEFASVTRSLDFHYEQSGQDRTNTKELLESVSKQLASIKDTCFERLNALQKENADLKSTQMEQPDSINTLTDRIISLESHMRRDNLKFLNIDLPDHNTAENCEEIILGLCSDLGVQIENKDIARAHRTGQKRQNKQPIIVKFSHFKVKQRVLKTKHKFREIGISVVEDFPPEILERRNTFKPILNAVFKSNGQYKARLVVDKLLLNGKLYSTSEISKVPRELLPQNTSTVTKNNITAFFTGDSPLSNHHRCNFNIDNQTFSSNEQYFMYCKASYFNDMDTARDILRTQNPKQAKSLGRQVKNFKMNAWRLVCDDYMRKGLKEKFVQNKQLGRFFTQD